MKVVAFAVALLAAPYGAAWGDSIGTVNQIVAFGDSLSDPGNLSYLAQKLGVTGIPPAGYATRTVNGNTVGYYTNPQSGSGPSGLWVDQLAGLLHVTDPAPASILGSGGTNFSIAGAETSSLDTTVYPGVKIPSMATEVDTFLTTSLGSASSKSLYTFWGGANDLVYGGVNPSQAANNVMGEIQQVAAAGGKYFIWVNLPPLGDTPEGSASGFSQLLNAGSSLFNTQWQSDIDALQSQGIMVIGVDVSSLFNQLTSSQSPFTNVTDPCYNANTRTSCADPNNYLFWDGEHPTTEADSFVADLAYKDLSGVPEPASYALLVVGACGLLALRRKRRQSTNAEKH